MHEKSIICLANSNRNKGGCVAGKVFTDNTFGEWIRPISERSTHEISEEELLYENGGEAKPLDIISIPLIKHSPTNHQVENHIINTSLPWVKTGASTWAQVKAAVDTHDELFWGAAQNSTYGIHDRIHKSNVAKIGSSLKLILVQDLRLHVCVEDTDKAKMRRRVRASFTLKDTQYKFSVTDPEIKIKYLNGFDGVYAEGEALLCISLPQLLKDKDGNSNYAYRLVASVITPERCTERSKMVFTVGHSNQSIEQFIQLLQIHSITAIADVRSTPYSQYSPQFNKEKLKASLKEHGIKYVFLGKELGARSDDEDCYVDGKVDYQLLAATPLFKSGIERVIKGSQSFKIALMCTEKDPLNCHRTILVSRELVNRGFNIRHILEDESIEFHNEVISRHSPVDDMFDSMEVIRGKEIAYEKADSKTTGTTENERKKQ